MNDDAPGTWHEYRRLVLSQLEALHDDVTSVRDTTVKSINELRQVIDKQNRDVNTDLAAIRERIAKIEGKAAAYGFVAGLIVSLLVALLKFVPAQPAPIPKPLPKGMTQLPNPTHVQYKVRKELLPRK